jgi:hypothetical protein
MQAISDNKVELKTSVSGTCSVSIVRIDVRIDHKSPMYTSQSLQYFFLIGVLGKSSAK